MSMYTSIPNYKIRVDARFAALGHKMEVSSVRTVRDIALLQQHFRPETLRQIRRAATLALLGKPATPEQHRCYELIDDNILSIAEQPAKIKDDVILTHELERREDSVQLVRERYETIEQFVNLSSVPVTVPRRETIIVSDIPA